MKKIVYFILFAMIFLINHEVLASYEEYNTEANITKAILMEDYIKKYIENIDYFVINYEIKNNKTLDNNLKELYLLVNTLKQIQNSKIKKDFAESIMEKILEKIKIINENLKINLKKEKENYDRKLNLRKQTYYSLSRKISDKIYSINYKIYNKNNFSNTQKVKIKNHLNKLNKEAQKLRNFWNIEFKSEKEIKEFFTIILKNIKSELILMNESLK